MMIKCQNCGLEFDYISNSFADYEGTCLCGNIVRKRSCGKYDEIYKCTCGFMSRDENIFDKHFSNCKKVNIMNKCICGKEYNITEPHQCKYNPRYFITCQAVGTGLYSCACGHTVKADSPDAYNTFLNHWLACGAAMAKLVTQEPKYPIMKEHHKNQSDIAKERFELINKLIAKGIAVYILPNGSITVYGINESPVDSKRFENWDQLKGAEPYLFGKEKMT